MRTRQVPLDKLFVSELNTRQDLEAGQEDSGIENLARSIQEKGLLSPLLVRPSESGRYEVIAGQHRLRACQRIKFSPVPCLIREDLDDSDAVTLSLVENVHRADMNPLDKARALKNLYDRLESYERVAAETAWSNTTISRYVALLDLPVELQQRVDTKEGSAGVTVLSKLARTFSGQEAVVVYDKIAGFKQSVQLEILRQSSGDVERVDDLVAEAMEGVFDVRQCGGHRCGILRDIVQGEIDEEAFKRVVDQARARSFTQEETQILEDATRAFWSSLARGDYD